MVNQWYDASLLSRFLQNEIAALYDSVFFVGTDLRVFDVGPLTILNDLV